MENPGAPPLISLPSGILKGLTGGKVAFIHTRRDVRDSIRGGEILFFNMLGALLADMGYQIALMPLYRPPWLRWINRKCLHIYRGPGRTWRGPGVLSAARGYIEGYYYLDPMGHRESSSIGAREFRPKKVPEQPAIELYGRLKRRYVHQGKTHREQAPRGEAGLPDGAIAIMLQGLRKGEEPKTAICTEAEMVRAVVAAREDRPVVIKYHPFGATPDVRKAVEDVVDPGNGVFLTEANVHDILDSAAMVCTQTSGVGFEAMLHRTPTVLFADADYAHAAIRVENMSGLAEVLATAPQKRFLYGKYVYWFLEQNLLRADAIDFRARAKKIITDVTDP